VVLGAGRLQERAGDGTDNVRKIPLYRFAHVDSLVAHVDTDAGVPSTCASSADYARVGLTRASASMRE